MISGGGTNDMKEFMMFNFFDFHLMSQIYPALYGSSKRYLSMRFISLRAKIINQSYLIVGQILGQVVYILNSFFPNAKIKAFEADPMIADVLKSNLAKNGISDVEIINKAVWVDDSGIEFGREGAYGGSIIASGNKIKVDSIRLKEYLEQEQEIDLLKIDIEGAEYEVLKDCANSLSNVKKIFVEYHSWNSSSQKLSEILKVLEINNFRYYIDNISKRKQPFINHAKEQNMDLQLNIFGVKVV